MLLAVSLMLCRWSRQQLLLLLSLMYSSMAWTLGQVQAKLLSLLAAIWMLCGDSHKKHPSMPSHCSFQDYCQGVLVRCLCSCVWWLMMTVTVCAGITDCRAREALRQCLPDLLRNPQFTGCLKSDDTTRRWLAQLLVNVGFTRQCCADCHQTF